jgi:hypothetical protein
MERLECYRNLKWMTKSGDEISVKNMETSHIKNALKRLQEVTLPKLEKLVMAEAMSYYTPEMMDFGDSFDYEIKVNQAYDKYSDFVIAFENELELRGEENAKN